MPSSDQKNQPSWRLQTDDHEIAWLWLDAPESSVNSLNQQILESLGAQLDKLQQAPPKGLIIASDKAAGFVAGADVKSIAGVIDRAQALAFMTLAHEVFLKLAEFPVPTCARIHGHCLGGGLEMALACRYRVAEDAPSTRLGFPEVMLGIHPGFGGVARSIRLLGAPSAMALMLSGRQISASRARRIGLVDQIVPHRHLDRVTRQCLLSNRPLQVPGFLPALADKPVFRHVTATYLRHQLSLRHLQAKHYPAPYALIDIWSRHGAANDSLFDAERSSVADLVMGDSAQNLLRLFLLQQRLKGLADKAPANIRFSHVHVIGAGVMGGDIAAWCALQGMQVTLQDMSEQVIGRALARARQLAMKKLHKTHLVTAFMDRLQPD
ncbi:MAG TPA: crotonase, partial [Gammaproteobacteria bacterium]|nr:crotonase [Gammaproteobacteria bacterium]